MAVYKYTNVRIPFIYAAVYITSCVVCEWSLKLNLDKEIDRHGECGIALGRSSICFEG